MLTDLFSSAFLSFGRFIIIAQNPDMLNESTDPSCTFPDSSQAIHQKHTTYSNPIARGNGSNDLLIPTRGPRGHSRALFPVHRAACCSRRQAPQLGFSLLVHLPEQRVRPKQRLFDGKEVTQGF
jgi:hypothetical protein